jgi:glycosyltransferase involved in cell wall biosynthesis
MLRVLMLGWELPPFISGGLGTACHGLTRAMSRLPLDVLFVLPQPIPRPAPSLSAAPSHMTYRAVPSAIGDPYATQVPTNQGDEAVASTHAPRTAELKPGLRVLGTGAVAGYGGALMQHIEQFAQRCVELTANEAFDVIHAHDWMTFPAAMRLARATGRPWVAHVHATEFDRSGRHVNQMIYDIERSGLHDAAQVITVSQRTRSMLLDHYAAPAERVQVIHNGIELDDGSSFSWSNPCDEPMVLFLGRLTQQKGPSYFIDLAARVLERNRRVKFVVAGWGDLGPSMIEQVAQRQLSDKILFTGFLNGAAVQRAFESASVYVMPSVSEPFGLTALEAVKGGAAVVLSNTTGVAEVLGDGAWTADYWDVDALAEHVLALLDQPEQAQALRANGAARLAQLTWDAPARRCRALYHHTLAQAQGPG